MRRNTITYNSYIRLILSSAVTALVSIVLVFATKYLTEHIEELVFETVHHYNEMLFVLCPTIGITAIYFLRKYAFRGRKNKGITEIYKTLDQRKEQLPAFKIPSHLINGFLTIVFGGSTGIEVSSVVATATVGNLVHKRNLSANRYKRELICAGVSSAVAVLFLSPLAGALFAMEVISRRMSRSVIVSCATAALVSWGFLSLFPSEPLLPFRIQTWNWYAMPLFVILSMTGGLLSVYFTLLVTRLKTFFGNINNNFLRVNLGAVSVGVMILLFPVLYGDSYHGLKEMMSDTSIPAITLLILIFLKPLAASLTLGAGGDGGVFAPSIVAGAILGLLFANACNHWFGLEVIPLNFALVGAAATLSASIYAPLTAIILACNLVPNGYQLFLPILTGSLAARFFAQKILPYNVYTYEFYLAERNNSEMRHSAELT